MTEPASYEVRLTNLLIACEELVDLGHQDLTAKALVSHLDPTLEGRGLRKAMNLARTYLPELRAKLTDRGYRLVPVAQGYFDHPTRLPQTKSDGMCCLAVNGRQTIALHFVPDGTEDILWTVYHDLCAKRQFASGVAHIASLRDAEEVGNALPGTAREAVDAAAHRAQSRVGGKIRRWTTIAEKTARALQIPDGTSGEGAP